MKNYSNEADINFLKNWGSQPPKENKSNVFIPLLGGVVAGAAMAAYFFYIKNKSEQQALNKKLESSEMNCAILKNEFNALAATLKKEQKEKIAIEELKNK